MRRLLLTSGIILLFLIGPTFARGDNQSTNQVHKQSPNIKRGFANTNWGFPHTKHTNPPPTPSDPPTSSPTPPITPPVTPPVVPPTDPVTPPIVPPVLSLNPITLLNVYTTGYSSYDNTPKGSLEIDLDGISGLAGGDGTYANPTTLAVGHSIINGKDIGDFPYGTIFYVSKFQKYFKASDSCGDTQTPQNQPCHSLKQAPKGATLWIDLYYGPSTDKAVLSCENSLTGLNTVIENPPANLPVIVGNIFQNGVCQ